MRSVSSRIISFGGILYPHCGHGVVRSKLLGFTRLPRGASHCDKIFYPSRLWYLSCRRWQCSRFPSSNCKQTYAHANRRYMTTSEFREWTKVTEPRMKWTMDPIRWHNNHEMLFYLGSQNGKFIWIYSDGRMQAGTYEGAMPHIMEACFNPTFGKTFDDQQEAYKRVVEIGGRQFLRSLRRVALEVEKSIERFHGTTNNSVTHSATSALAKS
jgi:hypothetical protein